MNVHLLTHLVDHVKLFGPLWTHSCFEFESANLRLRNLVHGKRYPDQQVQSIFHDFEFLDCICFCRLLMDGTVSIVPLT